MNPAQLREVRQLLDAMVDARDRLADASGRLDEGLTAATAAFEAGRIVEAVQIAWRSLQAADTFGATTGAVQPSRSPKRARKAPKRRRRR